MTNGCQSGVKGIRPTMRSVFRVEKTLISFIGATKSSTSPDV